MVNLDRARIKKLLITGLVGSVLTGIGSADKKVGAVWGKNAEKAYII